MFTRDRPRVHKVVSLWGSIGIWNSKYNTLGAVAYYQPHTKYQQSAGYSIPWMVVG